MGELDQEEPGRAQERAQRVDRERGQALPWIRVDKAVLVRPTAAPQRRRTSSRIACSCWPTTRLHRGYPSCSAIVDGVNGFAVDRAKHDVMFTAVSRAPLATLQA